MPACCRATRLDAAMQGQAAFMLNYRTRPAEEADAPFIYACYKTTMQDYVAQTWGWDETFQKTAFATHLPWQTFQIITIDAQAVGAVCVVDTSADIVLELIIVDPAVQSRGIGSDFVTRLLQRAHAEKRGVILRVMKVNPARALYERLGFAAVGEDDGTIEMRAGPVT
jgi:GNAT superfamily N-acetyltransferase